MPQRLDCFTQLGESHFTASLYVTFCHWISFKLGCIAVLLYLFSVFRTFLFVPPNKLGWAPARHTGAQAMAYQGALRDSPPAAVSAGAHIFCLKLLAVLIRRRRRKLRPVAV